MRKIIFKANTGYVGSGATELFEFDDSVTDKELDEEAYQFALDNADRYGYYPWPDDIAEDEISEEEAEQYTDGIEGWWEEYDPAVHDGTF